LSGNLTAAETTEPQKLRKAARNFGVSENKHGMANASSLQPRAPCLVDRDQAIKEAAN
jgi:hypothetical protein